MPFSTSPESAGIAESVDLSARFRNVRHFTKAICKPLEIEDYVVQSMPDVSPTRWHLAHTTWFFETFILKPFAEDYTSPHDAFEYLFNSYYNTVGEQFPRGRRGLLSRPTVREVWAYRDSIDEAMIALLERGVPEDCIPVVEIGLQHEQQHQELMLTDMKHVLSCNPLLPPYRESSPHGLTTQPVEQVAAPDSAKWHSFAGGICEAGFEGPGFHFDNESPRHPIMLGDYKLQDRLVTNREYLEFMEQGGYGRPEFWLSMGWASVQAHSWSAPLYWHRRDDQWHEYTMDGLQPLDLNAPVCHVSYFEADAFARWAGHRLPTEYEWEHAVGDVPITGNLAESELFHPQPADGQSASKLGQCFGDVWEWTSSQYTAYPGYRPPSGALGEYNGKFMCNQFVLRGGSCATSASHIRPTYRNFFPPEARWQFTGIRLAQ